jgi:protein gp37
MENSKIEWTDHTFNPWMGCTKVSPACDDCYAARATPVRAQHVHWGPKQPRVRTTPSNWRNPVKWEREASAFLALHGRRQRVFCASLADVFDNEVDPAWRGDLFALIRDTPSLDWLLLTKRIGNVEAMAREAMLYSLQMTADQKLQLPANVWLGATICNQEEAERDVPKLLAVRARIKFLSIEPMLGPIDLRVIYNTTSLGEGQPYLLPLNGLVGDGHGDSCAVGGIDWIIAGGESGPRARPSHPDWFRDLRLQCSATGVPFLFKQWGEWAPSVDFPYEMERWGKAAAGRSLDGVLHDGYPAPR